jgi:hypothetical protein
MCFQHKDREKLVNLKLVIKRVEERAAATGARIAISACSKPGTGRKRTQCKEHVEQAFCLCALYFKDEESLISDKIF